MATAALKIDTHALYTHMITHSHTHSYISSMPHKQCLSLLPFIYYHTSSIELGSYGQIVSSAEYTILYTQQYRFEYVRVRVHCTLNPL